MSTTVEETQPIAEDDIQIMDFSQAQGLKKKKKKTKKGTKLDTAIEPEETKDGGAVKVEEGNLLKTEGHNEYNYLELLERVIKQLKDKNPALQESGKLKQNEDPHVIKLGTTKTSWQNFGPMVAVLGRKPEHMTSYIAAELGVEATLGPEENMIL